MAEVREQRQRERAEARAGRHTDVDEPSQQEQADKSSVDLRRAVTTALAAAVTGALAGAAKAAVDKRGRGAQDDDAGADVAEDDQSRESTPEDEAESPEESPDEPEEEDGSEDEPEQDGEPAPQAQQQDGSDQTGASSSDVSSMVARAKQHVEAVLGSEAESVSGIERANGNWRVNVEVVQMRRVPESTDVLASFAVVLDGHGDLVSVQEVRRYRRSQAGDDR